MQIRASRPERQAVAIGVVVASLAVWLSLWLAGRTEPIGDEGGFLAAALRLRRGEVFYVDLDAYWTAGCAYLLAFAMDLFGERLATARLLAAASYGAMAGSLFAVALRVSDAGRALRFGLLLVCLKVVAWPALTAYYHTDLAFAAACVAIAVLVSPARIGAGALFAAGLAAGAAVLTKHNVGLYVLAAAGAVALRRGAGLRGLAALGAGALALVLPPLLYFAAHGALDALLWSTIGRPLAGYLPTSGVSFLPPLAWWQAGALEDRIHYSVSPLLILARSGALRGTPFEGLAGPTSELVVRAVYSGVLIVGVAALGFALRRGNEGPRERRLVDLTILTLGVAASLFPRADFAHVLNVAPLVGVLGLGLLAHASREASGPWLRRAEIAFVMACVVVCGAIAWAHQSRRSHLLDLPRARVRVPPELAYLEPLARGIAAEVPPGETIFVYGHDAHLYFLTGRTYPWRFLQLYPGQAGEEDGALARLLRDRPPARVLRTYVGAMAGLPPIRRYAPEVDALIRERFVEDRRFFARHPLPDGAKPPGRRQLAVLEPRP